MLGGALSVSCLAEGDQAIRDKTWVNEVFLVNAVSIEVDLYFLWRTFVLVISHGGIMYSVPVRVVRVTRLLSFPLFTLDSGAYRVMFTGTGTEHNGEGPLL